MLTLTGKFTLDDLKAAQALHIRPRGGQVTLYITLALLALFAIVTSIFYFLGLIPWVVPVLFFFIILALGLSIYVVRPYQIARAYKQHKELSSDFEMELSDEGYFIKNSYGTGKIPWKDFAKWKADSKIILLYRTDIMFNMVPLRLLANPAEAAYVLDQLKANGVREASKVKNPAQTVIKWVLYAILAVVILLMVLTALNK